LLSGFAALALSAGAVFAADLPSRKEAPVYIPPPPLLTWQGFYVGLNAGYTWSDSNSVNVFTGVAQFDPANIGGGSLAGANASSVGGSAFLPITNDGFIGGGQIGYNYQFSSAFVVGLEADIQGIAGSKNTASTGSLVGIVGFPANSISTAITASKSIDYLGTVRGRLGYLFTPTLLVYGTGGLAYGGVNSNTGVFQTVNGPSAGITTALGGTGSFSDTLVGWTAGGGVEWMFAPNWSAKAEYLYYDLGTINYGGGILVNAYTAPGPVAFYTDAVRTSAHFNGHVVRAGLNYHFNWGAAPVVAKY
jgi:outer membrane immunogenic protein